MLELLRNHYLAIRDANEIQIPIELSTKYSFFVDLKKTENVFLKFDFHRDKEIHRVKSEQHAVSAPDEDVLLLVKTAFDLCCDGAANLLPSEFWYLRYLLQGFLI